MVSEAVWVSAMTEVYDRCLGPVLFQPFAEHLAAAAAVRAPNRVLELAAGSGIATAALAAALPGADIIATDLNPAMVAWGAERVPGARWQQADAQQLNLADDSFDLVACQFGAMFFPDKPAAFAEIARVLQPEAATLFSIWDTVETSYFTAVFADCLAEVFPVDPPDFLTRIPHGYADPEQIEADVRAGGLRLDSIERVVLRGQAPSAASLAVGFCQGTPLTFTLRDRGSLPELTDALAELMTARLGPGPVSGDLAAFAVTATAPAS